MQAFTQKTFDIAELKGISAKNIEEHLKLYMGYVKNTNLILEKIEELAQDAEKNAYALGEVQRRFGFEYNGIRNHEIYFESLSGKACPLSDNSKLKGAIAAEWGSFENWLNRFKAVALTRGIGWAMLYFDKQENRPLNAWVDEQHLGQLQGCAPILALDMWEHAYLPDYVPADKKKYIEAFFENLNWGIVEKNFTEAREKN